jgi:hypothetical protein
MDYEKARATILILNVMLCSSYPLNFAIYCGMSRLETGSCEVFLMGTFHGKFGILQRHQVQLLNSLEKWLGKKIGSHQDSYVDPFYSCNKGLRFRIFVNTIAKIYFLYVFSKLLERIKITKISQNQKVSNNKMYEIKVKRDNFCGNGKGNIRSNQPYLLAMVTAFLF